MKVEDLQPGQVILNWMPGRNAKVKHVSRRLGWVMVYVEDVTPSIRQYAVGRTVETDTPF